jgi:hypothetical protein
MYNMFEVCTYVQFDNSNCITAITYITAYVGSHEKNANFQDLNTLVQKGISSVCLILKIGNT